MVVGERELDLDNYSDDDDEDGQNLENDDGEYGDEFEDTAAMDAFRVQQRFAELANRSDEEKREVFERMVRGVRCQSASGDLDRNEQDLEDMLDSQMPLVRSGSTNYLLDLDMDEEELAKIIQNAHQSHLQEYKRHLAPTHHPHQNPADEYDQDEVMIGGGVLNEDNLKPTEENFDSDDNNNGNYDDGRDDGDDDDDESEGMIDYEKLNDDEKLILLQHY